jgi:pectin methylesterase-like acyl-CoA thioesterase/lysophospholipase L1-like esterase
VLDRSGDPGNYLESSCSTMFTYALFKGVRKGYLDRSFLATAIKGYHGILKQFIEVDDNGLVSITRGCSVAGLGGKNYRDGSYEYYLSEPIRTNDAKAVGPFILASLEWERLQAVERVIDVKKDPAQSAYKHTLTVARDGTGDYRSLTEAMQGIRAFMDYTVTVRIKNGVYKEKVIIPAWLQNVVIEGESAEGTIITYDDHANIDGMGTFRTYTVRVDGTNITFRNLTIENNAPQMGQAVALHTQGERLTFVGCRLLGNQDTLLTGYAGGLLTFRDCYIEGTTDFIFGPSTALFEDCEIHSKRNSYITAASTPQGVAIGYVFHRCRLTAAPGVDRVYLGRPWRPYAMTVFIDCELGAHILPAGWHNWGKTENEQTARYAEYGNTGPGAPAAERVKWSRQLTKKEAERLLREIHTRPTLLTIFTIGDSTMANKPLAGGNPERGWAQMLPEYLTEEVRVDNHAQNGRSSKSFIDEGRWDKVLARLTPGDYVFIQFGHNDEKPDPARHTEPGSTFDDNLRRYVRQSRAKGAVPVLFNAIVRRHFVDGVLTDTHGAYLDAPRRVSQELNVPFVDANRITHQLVADLGDEPSKQLYLWFAPNTVAAKPEGKQDDTHLNVQGARRIAGLLMDAVAREVPALAHCMSRGL